MLLSNDNINGQKKKKAIKLCVCPKAVGAAQFSYWTLTTLSPNLTREEFQFDDDSIFN